MKTGEGRITKRTSGNRGYESTWLYIPSKLSKDKSFPFKDQEKVILELDENQLVVKKSFALSDLTKDYGVPEATLPHLVEYKAKINKDKPFLFYKDEVHSYKEINELSNQIAHGLKKIDKSLKPTNSKVALLLPNCPIAIATWFAISKIGDITIPINYTLKEDLLEFVIQNSEPHILIIDHQYYSKMRIRFEKFEFLKKIIIYDAPKNFEYNEKKISFNEVISEDSSNPKLKIKSSQPLEIIYTAGTIGKPKGILYRNHHTLSGISVGTKLKSVGFENKDHKIYCAVPIFQAFSRYLVIIPAMYYNSSVILSENFNPIKFWKDIDKFKPQGFCYLGAYLLNLMNQEPKMRDRKHSLNYAFGFGAFKKIWEAFERRFGIQIIESWSLVEAIGMTINEVGTKGGKAGSVGVPARGYELKIVDSKGNELPPGSNNIGEIVSRTRLPIKLEYINLESKSSARIGENRWVYTGDYGYKDFDNYIYFLGRKSDMIQRGNEIFFALDIERVANSHPQVLNSAVFEVPIENTSETALKICIELKDDSNLNYSDIHHYLNQNLAYFMVPRFIEIKDDLPKNVNDLIQKFILKENWQNIDCRRNTYDTKQKKMAE